MKQKIFILLTILIVGLIGTNLTLGAEGEIETSTSVSSSESYTKKSFRGPSPSGPIEITKCINITEPGEYIITKNIKAKKTPCIFIETHDVYLSGKKKVISGTQTGIRIENSHNIRVIGLTLDGFNMGLENINGNKILIANNHVNNYDRVGISTVFGKNVIIDRNKVENSRTTVKWSKGIWVRATSNVIVKNNIVLNATNHSGEGRQGITFGERRWYANVTDSTIIGNYIKLGNVSNQGIQLYNGKRNLVKQNIIESGYDGIALHGESDSEIIENEVSGVFDYGVFIAGNSERNLVENNILKGVRFSGIGVYNHRGLPVRHNIVRNNLIKNTTYGGIALLGKTKYNIITENTVRNVGYKPLYLEAESCENTITNNDFGDKTVYFTNNPLSINEEYDQVIICNAKNGVLNNINTQRLQLFNSNNVLIKNSKIKNLSMENVSHNIIINNEFKGMNYMWSPTNTSNHNYIVGNTFSDEAWYPLGIMRGSNDNYVVGNIFKNTDRAIIIQLMEHYKNTTSVSNNKIIGNQFINIAGEIIHRWGDTNTIIRDNIEI